MDEITLERRARIILSLVRGLGAVRAWRWIAEAGSAEALVASGAGALQALGASPEMARAIASHGVRAAADREIELSEKAGIGFLFPQPVVSQSIVSQPVVPEPDGSSESGESALDPSGAFRAVEAPPLVLTWKGRLDLLSSLRLRIAIVGTRTPTPYGAQQAQRFASQLSAAGLVVVSGFARGVDRESHRAALSVREDGGALRGDTIAVLGSGLLAPYPSDQPDLLCRIEREGLVLSEFPVESHAARENFPRRNRILSGISEAVLVIEAGSASGSLITARWAIDQGKEIFALPGRVDSPMSQGCHELLQRSEGTLVTSPRDILAGLGVTAPQEAPQVHATLGARRLGGTAGGLASHEVLAGESKSEIVQSGKLGMGAGAPNLGLAESHRALLEAAVDGATLDELLDVWTGSDDALFEAIVSLEVSGLLDRGPNGLFRSVGSFGPGKPGGGGDR